MTNSEGVFIRPIGEFGDTYAVEYIDSASTRLSSYFSTVVSKLIQRLNYTRMMDLFAATYDFRKVGDEREMSKFFQKLTTFLQDTTAKTGAPNILLTHSMGSSLTAHFLRTRSQAWKDKYIDSWYSIGGPFAGSTVAIESLLIGYTFRLPFVLLSPEEARPLQATSPSTFFLFPSVKAFDKDEVVVSSPDANYTFGMLRQLVREIDIDNITRLLDHIPDASVEEAPGVHTVCLFSNGSDTLERINFQGPIGNSQYSYVYGDGDTSVPLRSLRYCERWASTNIYPLEIVTINQSPHFKLLHDLRFINHLTNFVATRLSRFQSSLTSKRVVPAP